MFLIGLVLYLVGEEKVGGILMLVSAGLVVLSTVATLGLGIVGAAVS